MSTFSKAFVICILFVFRSAMAQVPELKPRVLTKLEMDGKVAVVEVAAHFVAPDPHAGDCEFSSRGRPDTIQSRALGPGATTGVR